VEAIITAPENPIELNRQIEDLQREMESLDRGEATLSLHPGRYFEGRRRELSIAPSGREDAARIRLIILTLDRFERSQELHCEKADLQPPTNSIHVLNRGTHPTPPIFRIESSGAVGSFAIDVASEKLTYGGELASNDNLLLDCENNKATLNETTNVTHLVDVFPLLPSGWSTVAIHVSGEANGICEITYRDLWV
ncbi:MAG: hypothetical protein ABIH23_24300, partial [bacterium]